MKAATSDDRFGPFVRVPASNLGDLVGGQLSIEAIRQNVWQDIAQLFSDVVPRLVSPDPSSSAEDLLDYEEWRLQIDNLLIEAAIPRGVAADPELV
jgi:hypothetical protein